MVQAQDKMTRPRPEEQNYTMRKLYVYTFFHQVDRLC